MTDFDNKNSALYQNLNNSSGMTMRAFWPAESGWIAKSEFSAAYTQHSAMLQTTYGVIAPVEPLSVVWVQKPNSTAFLVNEGGLGEAELAQYHMLGERLAEVVQLDEPPVEKGAVVSADQVLNALVHYKIQPPELSWHGGDAIVMFWRLGATSYAMTITDGELGYVVRAERKTLRRDHSIPIDDIGALVAG